MNALLQQRVNALLAKHPEIIGVISTGGTYCLTHAQEWMSGSFLNHLGMYDREGASTTFITINNASTILLPNSYYCKLCPKGTLLPTLLPPNIPCSKCGHITHFPTLRDAKTEEFGHVALWFCEECQEEHPEPEVIFEDDEEQPGSQSEISS